MQSKPNLEQNFIDKPQSMKKHWQKKQNKTKLDTMKIRLLHTTNICDVIQKNMANFLEH